MIILVHADEEFDSEESLHGSSKSNSTASNSEQDEQGRAEKTDRKRKLPATDTCESGKKIRESNQEGSVSVTGELLSKSEDFAMSQALCKLIF